MLAIKLQRIGKKHQPSYRLVVAPAKSKMAGPPVEDLGSYNPSSKATAVKKDRVAYWIGVGAQPTMTVHNLLVKQGVISAPKKAIKMKKAVVAPVAETEAPVATAEAEVPKAEVAEPAVEEIASQPAEAAADDLKVTFTEIEKPEA